MISKLYSTFITFTNYILNTSLNKLLLNLALEILYFN